ncbi:hypothetical protein DID88_010410 [Monilinia fructigena]|uniref:Chitin synthase A n=1 Tax=Monilinia fructigena TaxID=38457 RepID=A0A395IRT5_9HELO|nr:hypothetical protein DID88_010410 [Monilinia fructigena]
MAGNNLSLHEATPSILVPFLNTLPLSIPDSLYTALQCYKTIRPLRYSSNPIRTPTICSRCDLDSITQWKSYGCINSIVRGGIDTKKGLLNIPAEPGYRAFDVFYYLLTSASTPAEREFLSLKQASSYALLEKSGTYDPPSYLPTADDAAAADDFRASLKAIGIKGAAHRDLISILAGLLKLGDTLSFILDEDALEEICEDVGRETLIGGLYEALVDWVISKANESIASEMARIKDGDSSSEGGPGARTPNTEDDNGDTVCITVIEIPDPNLGKAAAMRGVFDDTQGINAEMKEDGVDVVAAGSSVIREMQNAVAEVAPDLGIMSGPAGRDREHELEKQASPPTEGQGINLGRSGRIDLPSVLGSSRVWYHLSMHPTDDLPAALASLPSTTSAWSAGAVSRQLRAWRLPEWANRRNKNLDFTADFDFEEFVQRYAALGCKDGRDGIESWTMERGWSNGEVVIGKERIWIREGAWWEAETMLDLKPADGEFQSMGGSGGMAGMLGAPDMNTGYSTNAPNGSGFFAGPNNDLTPVGSHDHLINRQSQPNVARSANGAPTIAPSRNISGGDYGLGFKGDNMRGQVYYTDENGEFVNDPEGGTAKEVTNEKATNQRRIWVAVTWAFTWWIPSFLLRFIGRMKRPDVRMAWREKLVLCFFIVFLNCLVVFWIIEFGKLLCPNSDKAWNASEISTHQGDNDFWVSIHGKVYDLSKFWKLQHSDTSVTTTKSVMQPFAGMNLDSYFPPPLIVACPGLVSDYTLTLLDNSTAEYPAGVHTSGNLSAYTSSKLYDWNWYADVYTPKIKEYYHGDLVVKKNKIESQGQDDAHYWVILKGKIYDFTNYYYTLSVYTTSPGYSFIDDSILSNSAGEPGLDITDKWDDLYKMPTPLTNVIVIKFVSALQFGSKRRPAPQDKFVICQVPAYTEGEDSLRKAVDSLTALQYDNKRKLICVICDGMVVGGGNDRPTPKIVLDILGVDPKIDPPPWHSNLSEKVTSN